MYVVYTLATIKSDNSLRKSAGRVSSDMPDDSSKCGPGRQSCDTPLQPARLQRADAAATKLSKRKASYVGIPTAPPTPDVEVKGQVTPQTPFGIALTNLAMNEQVELILEIGTWYGGGSTLTMAQALMRRGRGKLITIESSKEAHEYAKKTLAKYPQVELLLGTTVPSSSLPSKEDIMRSGVWASEKEWIGAFKYDQDTANQYGKPMLEDLCRDYSFDAVFIDGGEFAGDAEFVVTRDQCRPKFIALHDTTTYKTRGPLAEMKADPKTWRLVAESGPSEGAGWAIFERMTPYPTTRT